MRNFPRLQLPSVTSFLGLLKHPPPTIDFTSLQHPRKQHHQSYNNGNKLPRLRLRHHVIQILRRQRTRPTNFRNTTTSPTTRQRSHGPSQTFNRTLPTRGRSLPPRRIQFPQRLRKPTLRQRLLRECDSDVRQSTRFLPELSGLRDRGPKK